jgi:hypothetical protein
MSNNSLDFDTVRNELLRRYNNYSEMTPLKRVIALSNDLSSIKTMHLKNMYSYNNGVTEIDPYIKKVNNFLVKQLNNILEDVISKPEDKEALNELRNKPSLSWMGGKATLRTRRKTKRPVRRSRVRKNRSQQRRRR